MREQLFVEFLDKKDKYLAALRERERDELHGRAAQREPSPSTGQVGRGALHSHRPRPLRLLLLPPRPSNVI